MENTSVKLPVPSDMYETVKEIQQNLRMKEGKKTSLSEILLKLCQKGIESTQNEQNLNDFVQNNEGFAQNSEINALSLISIRDKNGQELFLRKQYMK